jgi:RibD C-terminal domain
MGLIQIDLFTTLDGVAQAPGGPDEDTDNGFAFGGWQAPLFDDVVGERVGADIAALDALLLGRKTYDIFAGYWPHQTNEIARVFNSVPKYVASRGTPPWSGRTRHCSAPTSCKRFAGFETVTRTCTSSAASTSCRRCSPSCSSTS